VSVSGSSPSHRQALEAVLARATTDRVFRAQLLHDPRKAIHDAFGVQIPADFTIKFIERDPDVDALIVLPDLREDSEDGGLSDEELEVVAGGAGAHLAWSRKVKPITRQGGA
jgi:hypothetical protein